MQRSIIRLFVGWFDCWRVGAFVPCWRDTLDERVTVRGSVHALKSARMQVIISVMYGCY